MLERILAFSRKQNKLHRGVSVAKKLAGNVDLSPVTVYPSQYLWQAQCMVYGAILVFALVALLPLFFISIYWVFLYLSFALWISAAIYKSSRTKNASPMQLEVKQNNWYLITKVGEFAVTPSHEILLWSWVIIIPLRETTTRKLHYVIALTDSLPKEDWRRLRVWLRTCFQ